MEEYFDTRREPFAYSSYISSQPLSDRFYDDNVWLGIDFTDSYRMTGKQAYLEKAKLIWKFILSGKDDVLGGGIYWCEQKKESKNTCSNAPGAVFALKLFQATQDDAYLKEGKELYEWTKKNLEAEIPAWDFEGVRTAAHNEWNNYLSRIEIEGTDDEKTNFYTCFYHALIQPNQFRT